MNWDDWFLDDEMEAVSVGDIQRLQTLLEQTTLEYEVRQFYERYIPYIDEVEEYQRVLAYFYQHKIDAIAAGKNYGQTEIKKKIQNEIL